MTQYNTLTVKLSNSQLNTLESGRKNGTEETLKLSSNVLGDSNDETNFVIVPCSRIIWITNSKDDRRV